MGKPSQLDKLIIDYRNKQSVKFSKFALIMVAMLMVIFTITNSVRFMVPVEFRFFSVIATQVIVILVLLIVLKILDKN